MLGILLPDDGPQRYEWHDLGGWLDGRGLPADLLAVAGTVCDGRHTEESLRRTGSMAVLAGPARTLAGRGAGAVLWACTSASFIGGLAWARAQADALRAASGRPAWSTALALLDAARHLGTDAVDLLSPYPADVTGRLVDFLAEGRVRAVSVAALDCPTSADSHRLDLTREVGRLSRSDRPLLVPDTAVDSLHRLDALEAAAGRPVVTANQASLWAGLRLLGRTAPVPRAGRLFAAP